MNSGRGDAFGHREHREEGALVGRYALLGVGDTGDGVDDQLTAVVGGDRDALLPISLARSSALRMRGSAFINPPGCGWFARR
ncbi:hypothetical protein ACKI1I_31240 [Streptomyces turgidiscabies]|uniref:hypothetical protein n=1 Tax=Streptomyces TaxID=1883 RepID=UPI001F291726|nr:MULTISPECIES: hypothetical protein [Streptomyces]MDX3496139.1 hypothetical protein [Streptomyces turgidiscabies]